MHKMREIYYEEYFHSHTVQKIKRDFKSKCHENSTVEYLLDILGDFLYTMTFLSWLKTVNFYIFERKEEMYFKCGGVKKYLRTAQVDKNMSMPAVLHGLLTHRESYLIHCSHLKKILRVFPLMKEAFDGR